MTRLARMTLAPILAAALTFAAAPAALAQTDESPGVSEPTSEPVVEDPPTVEDPPPAETPDEPAPEPEPTQPEVVDPPAPEPTTAPEATLDPDPIVDPTVDPTAPATVDPSVDPTAEPTVEPTVPVTVDPTASPTTDPAAPTTAPTTVPAPTTTTIQDIDVDVDIDDHSDHSIHYAFSYEANSTLIVEGDRYSNVYVYRDVDGRTYRGRGITCLDFDTQTDAQVFFDHADADLYWLDGDGDGFACESGSGEFTRDTATSRGVRRGGQVDIYPAGSIDTGRIA